MRSEIRGIPRPVLGKKPATSLVAFELLEVALESGVVSRRDLNDVLFVFWQRIPRGQRTMSPTSRVLEGERAPYGADCLTKGVDEGQTKGNP